MNHNHRPNAVKFRKRVILSLRSRREIPFFKDHYGLLRTVDQGVIVTGEYLNLRFAARCTTVLAMTSETL